MDNEIGAVIPGSFLVDVVGVCDDNDIVEDDDVSSEEIRNSKDKLAMQKQNKDRSIQSMTLFPKKILQSIDDDVQWMSLVLSFPSGTKSNVDTLLQPSSSLSSSSKDTDEEDDQDGQKKYI